MNSLLVYALTNAVLAAGIFAVVRVCKSRIRNPAVLHWLWVLVLLKLLTPPIWTPKWALLPVADSPAERSTSMSIVRDAASRVNVNEQLGRMTENHAVNPVQPALVLDQQFAGQSLDESKRPAGWRQLAFTLVSPSFLIIGVWVAGAIMWWGLSISRIYRLERQLRFAHEAPMEIQAAAALLAEQLGLRTCPRVLEVPGRLSPMLWAFCEPARIVIPRELFSELDHPARQTLLLHELVHLRRGDQWVRWLELISLGLYWWYPIAWLIRREIRLAEELACDASVVSQRPHDRRAYAEMLVKTVAFLSPANAPELATGVGTMVTIEERLKKIMGKPIDVRISTRTKAAICLLALLMMPFAPVLVQAQDDKVTPTAIGSASKTSSDNTVEDGIGLQGTVIDPKGNAAEDIEATLRGKVIDENGKPVAGARVDISTAAPKVGPSLFCPSCYGDCGKSAKSDDQGRFEFNSLQPTLKFRLLATATDKQTGSTDLLDPAMDTATITLLKFPEGTPPNRILMGRVQTAEGVPISGALVEPNGAKTSKFHWSGGAVAGAKAAVTDDRGNFRILLSEDFISVGLQVTSHGYPGAFPAEQFPPGLDQHEITVPTGTTVTGRIVLQGQPQTNQQVAVVQTTRDGSAGVFIAAVLASTDEAGRFRFGALPANQPYAIFSPVGMGRTGPVLPTMMFNARDNDGIRDLGDLELVPGVTLAGRLKMSDGGPVPKSVRLMLSREFAWDLIELPLGDDGSFRIEHLPPESYEVSLNRQAKVQLDESQANHQTLNPLAIGVRLSANYEDLVVPLRHSKLGSQQQPERRPDVAGNQTLSGTVVDRNGKPVSNIRVLPLLNDLVSSQSFLKSAADGSFTFHNLPDRPIDLMYFAETTEAGRYAFHGHAYPRINQTDIRLIYDSSLSVPIKSIE